MTKWRRLVDIDMQNPRQERILALPVELHLTIIQYLGFLDIQALRTVNQQFASLIKPATFNDVVAYEKDPLEHETSVVRSTFTYHGELISGPWRYIWVPDLTCSCCRRLRPRYEFADVEAKEEPVERCCIDWTMKPPPGKKIRRIRDEFTIDWVPHVWCRYCKMMTSEVGPGNGVCAECAGRMSEKFEAVIDVKRAWKRARRQISNKGEGFNDVEGRVGNLGLEGYLYPVDYLRGDYHIKEYGESWWVHYEWVD
jgi:hypothetical protein